MSSATGPTSWSSCGCVPLKPRQEAKRRETRNLLIPLLAFFQQSMNKLSGCLDNIWSGDLKAEKDQVIAKKEKEARLLLKETSVKTKWI